VTYGQGWSPPPAPPPQPRRYGTKGIWAGIAAGIATTIGFSLVGLIIGSSANQGGLASVLFLLGLAAPLTLGIVLAARQGTPARRGFGLGLIIGWAVAPIVFAGTCILIIVGVYTVPNVGR